MWKIKIEVVIFTSFTLLLFKKFFNWRLINFTILWWFLPYIHMNQPWVYMCSPSWTPLSSPSRSHPSGSSQCTSPKHPVSCMNLDWQSISHKIICMFQCYFLKSSHPCLLPQIQKFVIYIYVSFVVLHIGSLLPSF